MNPKLVEIKPVETKDADELFRKCSKKRGKFIDEWLLGIVKEKIAMKTELKSFLKVNVPKARWKFTRF